MFSSVVLAAAGCASHSAAPHDVEDPWVYETREPWVTGAAATALFPVQLGPDVAVTTVATVLFPVVGALHPDPHFGGNLWPIWWIFSPIVGPLAGIVDAWHGYGFWQPWMFYKRSKPRAASQDGDGEHRVH